MEKQIIFIVLTLMSILHSCSDTPQKERYYSMKSIQSGDFGVSDIQEILRRTDSLSESEVNLFFQGKKSFETRIHLPALHETITVYRWEKERDDIFTYYTEDSVKIAIICFLYPHSSDLYVLRDKRYESLILALIKHKKFELTRLNSLTAPPPPFIEPE